MLKNNDVDPIFSSSHVARRFYDDDQQRKRNCNQNISASLSILPAESRMNPTLAVGIKMDILGCFLSVRARKLVCDNLNDCPTTALQGKDIHFS
jgi:hypothetical protein